LLGRNCVGFKFLLKIVYNTHNMNIKNKKLLIPKKGKKLGGVSQAFANYFDVDVTLFRVVFVLLFIPGGVPGILTYFLLWLVIPKQK
jgi:phage shock protein C